MDPLVDVFDQLMDRLTEECTDKEKQEIKENFCKVQYMSVISLIWLISMKMGFWRRKP